ncbi:MAG TPA: hypothetical protein VNX21_07515 [Candidatus Thermoplasmatota archaeon]|nr:hypothetical protein [Candidatus Thermoplasmatota archaeon]
MVDERTDYRPAQSRDFARAVQGVDASDLRPTTPPPTTTGIGAGTGAGTLRADEGLGHDRQNERAYDRAYDRMDARSGVNDQASVAGARERADLRDTGARGAVAQPHHEPRERGLLGTRDRRYVDRPEGTTIEERVDRPVGARPFSIAAGFFGWAVASFFTLVLATLVLALLGAAAYDATGGGATGVTADTFNSLTTSGLVGLLVALFLAYLLGGYAAGRIGLWHGVGHGVAVVAWTVLFTILTIALGAWLGDAVAGLNLVPAIDWGDLAGPTLVGILLSLAAMLGGAILGAKLGTRPYGIDDANEGRRARAWRGRPL